jgi:hypothetical protein
MAASFDLSGTLLLSRIAGHPSQPQDYELWSSTVIRKLQELSDNGHQLLLFCNEGRIRTACAGKVAARTKGIVDWLATQVDRPLHAIVSTSTKSGFFTNQIQACGRFAKKNAMGESHLTWN